MVVGGLKGVVFIIIIIVGGVICIIIIIIIIVLLRFLLHTRNRVIHREDIVMDLILNFIILCPLHSVHGGCGLKDGVNNIF